MFVDHRDWPPPPPWQPPVPKPRLSARGERVVGWVVAANLLMLLVAPIAGQTIFNAVAVMLRGG